MSIVPNNQRAVFEAFHADTRFEELRRLRSQLQSTASVLRGNILRIRQGSEKLTADSAKVLREDVLHMLQLENAMHEACSIIPAEYEPVKVRILEDFCTEQPKAYLAKVNEWLRLIEQH
ncbi:hypothetical protein [Pseudomonas gingeri]